MPKTRKTKRSPVVMTAQNMRDRLDKLKAQAGRARWWTGTLPEARTLEATMRAAERVRSAERLGTIEPSEARRRLEALRLQHHLRDVAEVDAARKHNPVQPGFDFGVPAVPPPRPRGPDIRTQIEALRQRIFDERPDIANAVDALLSQAEAVLAGRSIPSQAPAPMPPTTAPQDAPALDTLQTIADNANEYFIKRFELTDGDTIRRVVMVHDHDDDRFYYALTAGTKKRRPEWPEFTAPATPLGDGPLPKRAELTAALAALGNGDEVFSAYALAPTLNERGQVLARVWSDNRMSNRQFHAAGKPNWWMRDETDGDFVEIPSVRGDEAFKARHIPVQLGHSYTIAVGKGRDALRERFTMPATLFEPIKWN